MAYRKSPVGVPSGGTGATTLTNHGLLVGGGTGAISAVGVGGTGQFLLGNTGANPAFGSTAQSDLFLQQATAGFPRSLQVTNTDNTNTSSTAFSKCSVGGTSAGDTWYQVSVGSTASFGMGIDNSDTQAFKMFRSASSTTDPSSGAAFFTSNANGIVRFPLTPCFLATLNAGVSNVTGNNTLYTVLWNGETFDQSGAFDTTTSAFTAQVDGRYQFNVCIVLTGVTTATSCDVTFDVSTGGSIPLVYINPGAVKNTSGIVLVNRTFLTTLSATNTAQIKVRCNGQGADTIGIQGGGSSSAFSGKLLA